MRSLQQINAKADIYRVVDLTKFEGTHDLKEGIYYGQLLDGKRDGYGIVYTNQFGYPYLLECEWKQGIPVNQGRYIRISYNEWRKYEGTIDQSYKLTGQGSRHDKDGYQYTGEWKQGNRHGQGKEIWASGKYYEGGWKDHRKHGQGRETEASGEYCEGEWTDDNKVGLHKYFTKEGVLVKTKEHRPFYLYEDEIQYGEEIE
ncbi:hypothetical protein FGO68_gene3508 [Halteria grandinella]|uniref:Uncharacterized protein n=1 Tax=Halteria grandinella TaxID=5974 RepID=A0A8J8NS21_HALGN|nr:hypothetical protein FGO68_gene3508 [Halteria grandinella]